MRVMERKIVSCGFCSKDIEVPYYKYKKLLDGNVKSLFCNKYCLANWQKINFKGEKSSR
jgi:hypothetical protein